jgi:hypothetical protein
MDDHAGGRPAARVVLVSGHRVDDADRPSPRFPQDRVGWVTDRVREAFEAWRVGPGTTLISGGARGADIIAAEQAHARGATVVLCLALPSAQFEQRSVALDGTSWSGRFRRLLEVAEVRVLEPAGPADDVFARTNAWMIDVARQAAPRPYALIVWNGHGSDGPGGTGDLVRRLGYRTGDRHLWTIDPTPAA